MDPLLIVALLVGAGYTGAAWAMLTGPLVIAWKGAGVALLAAWAWRRGRRWIAAVLALGAIGDVLIDAIGLSAGAIAFLLGHLLAIGLYRRQARTGTHLYAPLGAMAVAAAAYALTGDVGATLYAAALGGMAGAAAASRYSPIVAVGAALFVVSDLLIFARTGLLAGSAVPRLLVWPTYFAAQALIAIGVVSRPRERQA